MTVDIPEDYVIESRRDLAAAAPQHDRTKRARVQTTLVGLHLT